MPPLHLPNDAQSIQVAATFISNPTQHCYTLAALSFIGFQRKRKCEIPVDDKVTAYQGQREGKVAVHAQARRERLSDLNNYNPYNPITGTPTGRVNVMQRTPEVVDIRPEQLGRGQDRVSKEMEHMSQVRSKSNPNKTTEPNLTEPKQCVCNQFRLVR